MKKKKIFNGLIPFDLRGDLLHYSGYETPAQLSEDQLVDGYPLVRFSEWDKNLKKYVDKWQKSPFTLEEVNFERYETPRKKQWSDTIAVGECKSVLWVQNYEFDDTLEISTYSRGRSAANFQLESKITGREYTVFMSNFLEIVMKMKYGVIEDRFTFVKQGQNYGLRLVTE